jgi:hypothetical protein
MAGCCSFRLQKQSQFLIVIIAIKLINSTVFIELYPLILFIFHHYR